MIRALDLFSFLLFLLGTLLAGYFGTWQDAAPFWPGAACIWLSALLGVFTLHWRQRGRLSRSCVVLTVLFTAYILWRGMNSSVAFLARQDMVFCATAFAAWVQMAGRFEQAGRRYAVMGTWGLLIVGNLAMGLWQKYVDDQANPLRFIGFRRDTVDAVFTGFFTNSNHLCGFMELTGILFLAVAVLGRVGRFEKALCWLVFAAALLNVVLSTSRGGLAFGIGTLLFAGLAWGLAKIRSASRHGSAGKPGLQFVGVLVLCVAAGWIAWSQLEQKFGKGNVFKNLNGRAEVWGRAYEQWQEAPIMGTGARSFEYYERSYRSMLTNWITWSDTDVDAIFAHNDWLQLLADYGLIGLLLGCAVLGIHCWKATAFLLRDAWGAEPGRLFQDHRGVMMLGALCGMIAFAIHCGAEFHMHIGANAVTAAMVLGMMANPGSREGEREGQQLDGPRAWRIASLLPAAAACGVMAWKSPDWAIGDWYTYRNAAIPEVAQGTPEEKLSILFQGQQAMMKAVEADPLNGEAWALLGRTEGAIGEAMAPASGPPSPLTTGYLRRALGRFEKAVALYPQNPVYSMYLGATLDQLGRTQESEQWWVRALEWGNGSRLIHHAYADHCMLTARYQEAYEHYIPVLHKSGGATRAMLERKQKHAYDLWNKQIQAKEKANAAPAPAPGTPPAPNTPPAPAPATPASPQ